MPASGNPELDDGTASRWEPIGLHVPEFGRTVVYRVENGTHDVDGGHAGTDVHHVGAHKIAGLDGERWGKDNLVRTEKDGFIVLDRSALEALALT